MTNQFRVALLVVGTVLGGAFFTQATQTESSLAHIAWVTESLKRMETVKPGMTRQALLTVFTTEGGLSNALHRTFVSQDCPYFKVDVEFKARRRSMKGEVGRVVLVERDQDVIVKISRPYLQFSIND